MFKSIIISVFLILLIQSVSAKKETLFFDLKYGFAKGGEAVLTISDTTFNGSPAIYYHMIGYTTGISEMLFGIKDIYETIVDAKTHLPLKTIRNIRENKYRWYNETYFYHDIDSINSNKTGWNAVPNNLTDFLSVIFYYINNHLVNETNQGTTVTLPNYHAGKVSDITIKYLGDKKIKTALGEINTSIVISNIDKGKVLDSAEGIRFFISKDNKIPVALEFDLTVGELKAILKNYKINNIEQVTK